MKTSYKNKVYKSYIYSHFLTILKTLPVFREPTLEEVLIFDSLEEYNTALLGIITEEVKPFGETFDRVALRFRDDTMINLQRGSCHLSSNSAKEPFVYTYKIFKGETKSPQAVLQYKVYRPEFFNGKDRGVVVTLRLFDEDEIADSNTVTNKGIIDILKRCAKMYPHLESNCEFSSNFFTENNIEYVTTIFLGKFTRYLKSVENEFLKNYDIKIRIPQCGHTVLSAPRFLTYIARDPQKNEVFRILVSKTTHKHVFLVK